jgi:hypothetical protein
VSFLFDVMLPLHRSGAEIFNCYHYNFIDQIESIGQGCNQALADGPLLASWLTKNSHKKAKHSDVQTNATETASYSANDIEGQHVNSRDSSAVVHTLKLKPDVLRTRIRCFEREMVFTPVD